MLKRASLFQNQKETVDSTEETSLSNTPIGVPFLLSRPKPVLEEDNGSYCFRITALSGLNQTTFQQNRTNPFFFHYNNFLFDYIVDFIILFNREEKEMAPPQIDYNSQTVKNFISQLNTVLSSLDQGVDEKTHDKFWQSVKQEDLATVYLTILLGKLIQMDTKALQTAATNVNNNNNSSNNNNNSNPNSSNNSTPVDNKSSSTNNLDTNGNNEEDDYQLVSPREVSFNTDELRFDAQEVLSIKIFLKMLL